MELFRCSVFAFPTRLEIKRHTRSSPIGPAEHEDGGSLPKSESSLLMRFRAILVCVGWSVVGKEALMQC